MSTYGLSHSVEGEVELFDHVTSVLRSTVHGNHSSSLFSDVVLLDQSEDQSGHVELLKKKVRKRKRDTIAYGIVREDGLIDGIENGQVSVAQRVDGMECGVSGHLLHGRSEAKRLQLNNFMERRTTYWLNLIVPASKSKPVAWIC